MSVEFIGLICGASGQWHSCLSSLGAAGPTQHERWRLLSRPAVRSVQQHEEEHDGHECLTRQVDAEEGRVLQEGGMQSQHVHQHHEQQEEGRDEVSQADEPGDDGEEDGLVAEGQYDGETGARLQEPDVAEHDGGALGLEAVVDSAPPEQHEAVPG